MEELVRNGGNRRRAALATYDTEDPDTASSMGWENLRKPDVKAYLDELLDFSTVGAKEILAFHSDVLTSSIEDAINDAGQLSITQLQQTGSIRYVKAISQEATKHGGRLRIEFYDKQRSAEALAKVHGLDRQVVTHEPSDKLKELLAGLRAPWTQPKDSGE